MAFCAKDYPQSVILDAEKRFPNYFNREKLSSTQRMMEDYCQSMPQGKPTAFIPFFTVKE